MLPPGSVIRQLDLGYHSLAADLLFIRANLYYGHHMYTDEQLSWLPQFIDNLVEVDPLFHKAYHWGALVTVFYRREIDVVPRSLVERANRLLEAGMQRFPDDPSFPARIASNLYYELGEVDASLDYFLRAASLPGAEQWVQEKNIDLLSRSGRKKAATEVLHRMIALEEDPALSRALRSRMAYLLAEPERKALEQRWRGLLREWKASYPYLDLNLYLLIRDRGPEASRLRGAGP